MDEIVRNLSRCRARNARSIKESLAKNIIIEADEDEETLDTEEVDTEVEETPAEDIPAEETPTETQSEPETSEDEESNEEDPSEEEFIDPDGDTEEENKEDEESHEYVNPLDNPYAVKHTIGDEVVLAYSNGTNSKLKGEIDGYDKEGFYRILWSNGLTTDGITDLALADIIEKAQESKCVCGNTEFVTEGKHVVCDSCGRKIREAKVDHLTAEDKKRPAGKRMIRSEAHPMSTSISETIKNAFKKQRTASTSLKEDSEVSLKLSSLKGQFWTRASEIVDDIEELGYEVIDHNSEYIVLSYTDEEGDEGELQIPIVGTARTMTLDLDRMRFLVGMDVE